MPIATHLLLAGSLVTNPANTPTTDDPLEEVTLDAASRPDAEPDPEAGAEPASDPSEPEEPTPPTDDEPKTPPPPRVVAETETGPTTPTGGREGATGLHACPRPGLGKAGLGIAAGGLAVGIGLMLPGMIEAADGSGRRDSDANLLNEEEDDGTIESNVDASRMSPLPRKLFFAGIGTMVAGLAVGVPLLAVSCSQPTKSKPKPETARARRPRLRNVAIQPTRGGAAVRLGVRF